MVWARSGAVNRSSANGIRQNGLSIDVQKLDMQNLEYAEPGLRFAQKPERAEQYTKWAVIKATVDAAVGKWRPQIVRIV